MLKVIIALLFWSSFSFAAGFASGDEYDSTYISGQVDLTCYEGGQRAHLFTGCQDNILSPHEMDYFVADGSQDIAEVKLSSIVDGKKTEQTHNYNSEKGRSSSRFNLWIWSLTQRPLLQIGSNKISYDLKLKDGSKKSGEFTVTVNKMEPRRCRIAYMTSYRLWDCQSPSTFICDQYFSQQDYCQ